MHYFVTDPTPAGLAILYEVEREREDLVGWTTPDALARDVISNKGYEVRTEDELRASGEGRAALEAWRAGDDAAHHASQLEEFEAWRANAVRARTATQEHGADEAEGPAL